MTLNDTTEKRVYDKLRAFDGVELAGHEPVDSSIASVLSEGEVLGDDGEQYSSIQAAVDNSDSWVFVGPGTYYENVVIDKDEFTLQGSGKDTVIDGGNVGNTVKSKGDYVSILSISARNSANSGYRVIDTEGQNNNLIKDIYISESGGNITVAPGSESIVDNVTIDNVSTSGTSGIYTRGVNCIVKNCRVDNVDSVGIKAQADNTIITNCISQNNFQNFASDRNDCIIIGNRAINASGDGIRINSAIDNTVANNRISDSSGADIQDNGTGTITDGNLTGAAN